MEPNSIYGSKLTLYAFCVIYVRLIQNIYFRPHLKLFACVFTVLSVNFTSLLSKFCNAKFIVDAY